MSGQLGENGNPPAELVTPERNRYFYGKLLNARHFDIEQDYFNHKRWLLNRLGLGRGVVCGLDVVPVLIDGDWRLQIGSGVAIDLLGREIIVPKDGVRLPIDPRIITDDCGCPTEHKIEGEGSVTIYLAYHECYTEPVPALLGECEQKQTCESSIVCERYKVIVQEREPPSNELDCFRAGLFVPPGSTAEDSASKIHESLAQRVSDACPTPGAAPCAEDVSWVALAHVQLPPAGEELTSNMIDLTVRPVVYNNPLLFQLLLCLAERVETSFQVLHYVSGQAQSGEPGDILNERVVVQVVDSTGATMAGVPVTFRILGEGGHVSVASRPFAKSGIATSNVRGRASAVWQIGSDPGLNTLEATIPSGSRVIFHALAEEAERLLLYVSGDAQSGERGDVLAPKVKVVERADPGTENPIAGEKVIFRVQGGAGRVREDSQKLFDTACETNSTAYGIAEAEWQLGSPGLNTLEAMIASGSRVIFHALVEEAEQPRLKIVSGDGQEAEIDHRLPKRIAVKVYIPDDSDPDADDGDPVVGENVTFTVTSGGGRVTYLSRDTDSEGIARTRWRLGPDVGRQTVVASILGAQVEFEATAFTLDLCIESGDEQEAGPCGLLKPIVVKVFKDVADSPPVEGETVMFEVTNGRGQVTPPTVDTDSKGLAVADWRLGPGAGKQTVRASIASGAQVEFEAHAPGERAEARELRIGAWQKVTSLNPYLSIGRKDILAASLVLEPLACYDDQGKLEPVLAVEIPTVEHHEDPAVPSSITWQLREGIKWWCEEDEEVTYLTAHDVVRTFEYVQEWHPCAASTRFADVESVEAIDDLTVRINFSAVKKNPYGPFVSYDAPILQSEQLERCLVDQPRVCSGFGFWPIGTGPYRVEEFSDSGDLTFVINEHYRDPFKPAFSNIVFKYTNDINVLEKMMVSRELDYLIDAHFDPEALDMWTADGKVNIAAEYGTAVECLVLRVDWGERDEEGFTSKPSVFFQNPQVVQALSAAIDREKLAESSYGYRTDDDNNVVEDRYGRPTCNIVVEAPPSGSVTLDNCALDPDGASQRLKDVGWIDGDDDGIREAHDVENVEDGTPFVLGLRYPNSLIREKTAGLVAEWWNEIGVGVGIVDQAGELIEASEPVNPECFFGFPPCERSEDDERKNYVQFPADIQLYTTSYRGKHPGEMAFVFRGRDPETFLRRWHSDEIPKPTSKEDPPLDDLLGPNVSRFYETWEGGYDQLVQGLAGKDGQERVDRIKLLDEYLVTRVVIPLIHRKNVSLYAADLWNSCGPEADQRVFRLNPWDSEFWNIEDWNRR